MVNLLIIFEEFNPTEEIVIGALNETQNRGICQIKALRYTTINASDLSWADAVFIIRGKLWLTARLMKLARRMNRFCIAYWDDDYSELFSGLVLSHTRAAAFRQILLLSDVIVSPNPMLAEKLSLTVGSKRTAVLDTIVEPPEATADEPAIDA
ncbi:MAG: hypothetical protein Q8S22_02070, partial [Eubacteriales bacterium]|nr:hypothetical protein [Eubacteriales bacterium]